jgi:hypothetical protein
VNFNNSRCFSARERKGSGILAITVSAIDTLGSLRMIA